MKRREIVLWVPEGRSPSAAKSAGRGATKGRGPGPVYAVEGVATIQAARARLVEWLGLRARWEQLGAEGRAVLEQEYPLLRQVREVTSA